MIIIIDQVSEVPPKNFSKAGKLWLIFLQPQQTGRKKVITLLSSYNHNKLVVRRLLLYYRLRKTSRWGGKIRKNFTDFIPFTNDSVGTPMFYTK
jgi:hypothetical protein